MSASISTHKLPASIEVKLRNVRVRHTLNAATGALAIGWCVLVVLMILAMGIDWCYPFMDPVVRVVMTMGTLVATGSSVAWVGAGPIRNALRWNRAASAVDDGIPQLQERWSTVASLSARDHANESPLAQAMASQVTSEAVAMGKIVQPSRVAPPKSLRPAVLAAIASTCLLAILWAFSPIQMSVLFNRFWSPNSAITATRLTSLTGDQLVPRGESIELVTKLDGVRRSSAMLTIVDREGLEQNYQLRPNDESPNQFVHVMRVDETLTYRVRSGDGQTDVHRLQAIDFPEMAEVDFTIEFPPYTDRPSVQRDQIPRLVKVIQGSTLSLGIKPVSPLERLSISLASTDKSSRLPENHTEDSDEQVEELFADEDGWYRFRMKLLEDVLLRPTLWSSHGLKNQRRLFSRIEVIADKAPVARVVSPSDEMAVAVDDTIEIEFEAHDDHGLATAELVIYDESQSDADGNPKIVDVREIPLGNQRLQKHVLGKTQLDLKSLKLAEGAEISYAIRVTDNRNVTTEDAGPDGSMEDEIVQQDDPTHPSTTTDDIDGNRIAKSKTESLASREKPNIADNSSDMSANVPIEVNLAEMLELSPKASDEGGDSSFKSPDASPQKSGNQDDNESMPGETTTDVTKLAAKETPSPESANEANPASVSASKQENRSDKLQQDIAPTAPSAMKREDQNVDDAMSPTSPNNSPAVASLANMPRNQSQSQTDQPPGTLLLQPQQNRSGQNTLTNRRRLKITERLAAIAKAELRPGEEGQIRENVVEIDEMLAALETGLRQLVDHRVADADRGEQFRRLDTGLGNVESYVADLREQTKENQFTFVGLQMVDITRTHVTPARDRVFSAIQRPNASDADASASLQHLVRARELLAALLKRYDRVAQEKKLEKGFDDTVTMYEVYVEKRRILMREQRQNRNPLERKMAVIEVDQEYLDRFAEVLRLRREMMEEFGEMLGDDPRLLSRYMDLIKRRRDSLRDRLTDISQRQYDATEEMLGWLQIDETQRPDLWEIIIELRLHSATELAEDAADLAERIEKQMPLELDSNVGTPAEVIRQAQQIASVSRTISFDADEWIANAGQVADQSSLLGHARSLVASFQRLSALLDRLNFENEGEEAVADYVDPRMLESRTLADRADAWAVLCDNLANASYAGLVNTEQHRLAVTTQLLRVEMLNMKSDLDGQFQRLTESPVPDNIVEMIEQLHRLMEGITFNQAAASIRAAMNKLESAAEQQQIATDRLEEAEKLFDRIRRAVVENLDEYDVRDPNIADLRDPTLDEFLARLEREPSISAQLGIPNRRQNFRVIADSMLWQEDGGAMLGSSGDAAAERAKAAMKMRLSGDKKQKEAKDEPQKPLSEEQQERMAEAKKAQEMLEKSLIEIEKKRDAPDTPDGERQRLRKLADDVKQMLEQSQGGNSDSQTWQRMAQSDEAKSLVEAIAKGEAIPDEQWNKLLSTLDDGLWQVRGKQPPEAYRKAIEQYQDKIRELMQTIDEG